MATIREAQTLVSHMRGQRDKRLERWLTLRRWICPWRGRLALGEEDPTDRELPNFTHCASHAALRGASGMSSGMTPRNISWFKPSLHDSRLMELSGCREWLDILDRVMKEALAQSGFYQAIQSFNLDLLWAGCAMLYCEEGDIQPLGINCLQVGTFLAQTDNAGHLRHAARLVTYTAQEADERFGLEKFSRAIQARAAKNPLTPVNVWHLATPGRDRAFPIDSYFWEEGGKEFLHQGGFSEMPYFFAAWNEGATPYGTGPGDNALPDAMQIDLLERHKLAGLGRLVSPPVVCPPNLKDQLDLEPGAINYAGERDIIRPILDLSPYAAAMKALLEEIGIVAGRIDRALMASIFTSIAYDQRPAGMSATEFLERKREALQQLGPVISAYEPNVLAPLLFRVANILQRRALIPLPPENLKKGREDLLMKMDFISPMANALRQTGAETTRALVQDVAGLYQITQRQEIFDKLDLDQAIDELATGIGAPGSILRSDEDVENIRREREKAARAQAQAEQEQAQAMQAMQALGQMAQAPQGAGADGLADMAGQEGLAAMAARG